MAQLVLWEDPYLNEGGDEAPYRCCASSYLDVDSCKELPTFLHQEPIPGIGLPMFCEAHARSLYWKGLARPQTEADVDDCIARGV